jgi:hypothetical protein
LRNWVFEKVIVGFSFLALVRRSSSSYMVRWNPRSRNAFIAHWNAAAGGSWLGATVEVAVGRPHAAMRRADATASADLVKG